MAKKKIEVEAVYDTDKFIAEIQSEYGDGIIIGAEHVLNNRPQVISMSPAHDLALGGGIPEGSWITFTGPPKCGKTTSAMYLAVKAQRPEYGNRHVFYLNIEGRIKAMNLEGMPGLDLNRFHIVQSTRGNILDAKKFLNIGTRILKNNPGCVLLIDSLSALAHEKELLEGVGTSTRGATQALSAQFCRDVAQTLPNEKNIVIAITHIGANTSGYGAATVEKSGFGAQYSADVKLRCKSKPEPWKLSTNGKQIGQIVTWIADFTALGAPPCTEFQSYIRYGVGIDELTELIVLSMDFGIIEGTTWLSSPFFPEGKKLNGKEALREFLVENPSIQTELFNKIKEVI